MQEYCELWGLKVDFVTVKMGINHKNHRVWATFHSLSQRKVVFPNISCSGCRVYIHQHEHVVRTVLSGHDVVQVRKLPMWNDDLPRDGHGQARTPLYACDYIITPSIK